MDCRACRQWLADPGQGGARTAAAAADAGGAGGDEPPAEALAHLEACAACRALLEADPAAPDLRVLAPCSPPAGLEARVLAAFRAPPPGSAAAPAGVLAPLGRLALGLGLAVLLLLAVVPPPAPMPAGPALPGAGEASPLSFLPAAAEGAVLPSFLDEAAAAGEAPVLAGLGADGDDGSALADDPFAGRDGAGEPELRFVTDGDRRLSFVDESDDKEEFHEKQQG